MKKYLFLALLLMTIIFCSSIFVFAEASDQTQTSDDMLQYAGIAIVPLIIGISEAIKRFGFPTKFIPIINIILGVIAGLIITKDGVNGLFIGIAVGLAASGLYSGSKNVIQGFSNPSP